MLNVIRPGAQTIVVDRGRFGYRHLGVAWCGAADRRAYDDANDVLGNRENAPALEVTLGAAEFQFAQETNFVLTGADCRATIDGAHVVHGRETRAAAGAVLRLQRPERGMRTILAVRGGFDVAPVLGSASTDLAAGLGGLHGRALHAGDGLVVGGATRTRREPIGESDVSDGSIRMIPGFHFDRLDSRTRALLFATEWIVSHESSRMGYRLRGASLNHALDEIPSQAVFPGMIQLPPSGEPIVLLCDAQTTGGYPVIGSVIDRDLSRIAQLRSGDTMRFAEVSEA